MTINILKDSKSKEHEEIHNDPNASIVRKESMLQQKKLLTDYEKEINNLKRQITQQEENFKV